MSNPVPSPLPPQGVDRDAFALAYLAAHESPCPACGYNLHALTTLRCPECGRTLEVKLVQATGFNRAWATMLLTSSVVAGIGILIVVISIAERGLPRDTSWRIILNYFMLNTPVPLFLLAFRRFICRIKRALLWILTGFYVFASAAMLAWILLKVRH